MVIESLAALLNGALDRVIELKKHEITHRKEMFEKIFEPSFNDLQAVHTTYLDLFRQAGDGLCEIAKLPDDALRLEKTKQLAAAIEERRAVLYASRDKIHALTNVLMDQKLPAEEQLLVAAFRTYFESLYSHWSRGAHFGSDLSTAMEWMAEALDEGQVKQSDALHGGKSILWSAANLKKTWAETCQEFAKLKVKIVSLH